MPAADSEVREPQGAGGLRVAWQLLAGSFLLWVVIFTLLAVIGGAADYPLLVSGGHSRYFELGAGCAAFALLAVGWLLWRRQGFSLPLAGVLLLALLWLNVVRQESPHTWDFDCYFWTGRLVGTGVSIYDWQGQAEALHHARLPYPPFLPTLLSLSRLIPADELALEVSFLLWTALNYWATVLLACLLPAVLTAVYRWPLRAAVLAAVLALAVNVPLQRTLYYSQVNVLIVDCFLVFLLLGRRRPWLAGVALAVPALIKSAPLLLAGLLVPARRPGDLARFLLVLAALVGASMLVVGVQPWRDFLQVVPHVRDDVVDIYRENSLFNLAQVVCRGLGLTDGRAALGGDCCWPGWRSWRWGWPAGGGAGSSPGPGPRRAPSPWRTSSRSPCRRCC